MAPSPDTVRKLMTQISDGDDIVTAIKSLAVLDIPLKLATDLKIIETLTPLSGSPLLNGSIHEILKKLDGKRGKETAGKSILKKKTSVKRVTKSGSKKRRSSGVTKKIPIGGCEEKNKDVKENQKISTRRFIKKEPKKKDSAIWKKIEKVQN